MTPSAAFLNISTMIQIASSSFELRSIILCCVLALASTLHGSNLDYVNPFIGTDGRSNTEYGGMMPFVVPPFGMTSWTPQARQNKISRTSYRYSDSMISGFMGTHQSVIWMGDFGYVTVMPELDWIKTTPEARQLPFSHANETATPYYYSVVMEAGAERTLRSISDQPETVQLCQPGKSPLPSVTLLPNGCGSIILK